MRKVLFEGLLIGVVGKASEINILSVVIQISG
jgi:hypothetical protein